MAKKDIRVVKPTATEQKIIDKRLRAKYPQMFEKVTQQRLDKVFKKKTTKSVSTENALKAAGLTDKEIARLAGKK